mmetsp:Transcript_55342/g.111071  ORF Transcript_55342/g.111071 Transcript_55342/m.111071 type:complete len:202 (+) Transcript_55342:356-961(+)
MVLCPAILRAGLGRHGSLRTRPLGLISGGCGIGRSEGRVCRLPALLLAGSRAGCRLRARAGNLANFPAGPGRPTRQRDGLLQRSAQRCLTSSRTGERQLCGGTSNVRRRSTRGVHGVFRWTSGGRRAEEAGWGRIPPSRPTPVHVASGDLHNLLEVRRAEEAELAPLEIRLQLAVASGAAEAIIVKGHSADVQELHRIHRL